MKPIDYPSVGLKRVVYNLSRFWDALEEKERSKTFSLDSAVLSCGYGNFNGAARDFLSSARSFKLIDFHAKEYVFNFTNTTQKVLAKPPQFEDVLATAITPTIFQELYTYFNKEITIPRDAVIAKLSSYGLTNHHRLTLANSFQTTLEFVRRFQPTEQKPRISLSSANALVSLQYPLNYSDTKLRADFEEILASRTFQTYS